MPEKRPLEIVQQLITDYTPRCPADTDVIFDAIASAIASQGEVGLDFAQNLVSSLDEQDSERRAFTTKPARIANNIGEAAFDITLDRFTRMGCLATIAAMSLVHAPLSVDPLRAAGSAGHEVLRNMHDLTRRQGGSLLEFIIGLTEQSPVDPAALAYDLAGLPAKVGEKLDEKPTEEAQIVAQTYAPGEKQKVLGDEQSISMEGVTLSKNTKRISWLDEPLRDKSELFVRPIAHDGQIKGYLADLTRYNPTLAKLMHSLQNHEVYEQFRTRLSITLVRFFINPSTVKRIPEACQVIPTYYSWNPSSNENITRGYFAHLGKAADGKPLLGLLAAVRTKKGELQALNIIERGTRPIQIEGGHRQ